MTDDGLDPPWPVNAPFGIQLSGPDLDADVRMLVALGAVVRASSQLESTLRSLFVSLEGSKYAAITAAGQGATWLLDLCEALVKRHTDVSHERRAQLSDLLTRARRALQERNRCVHDVWSSGIDGGAQLMRSQRRNYDLSFRPVTVDGLVATSQALIACAVKIEFWTSDALGEQAVGLEAQLRWEDYLHSLSSDELEAMVRRRQEAQEQKQAGQVDEVAP